MAAANRNAVVSTRVVSRAFVRPFAGYRSSAQLVPLCRATARLQSHSQGTETGTTAATSEEEEANKRRWEESGGSQGSVDKWRWTLNWDDITPQIVVGSCPRSPQDMDRLVKEAGITAVLCLQSDLCLEALEIAWGPIRERAVEHGVLMTRVAIRDFDPGDQALMLPEAVRVLDLLLALGRRVYVHCTAGINRATLTVVGHMTFVQGCALEEAVAKVKLARPQAHPYIDCWKTVRGRLVEGRTDEVGGLAKGIYSSRKAENSEGDNLADWGAAEDLLIRETFQRQLATTLSLVSSITDLKEAQLDGLHCSTPDERDAAAAEVSALRSSVQQERRRMRQVLEELRLAKRELADIRDCQAASGGDEVCDAQAMEDARQELASFRVAMHTVAESTKSLLQAEPGRNGSDGALSKPATQAESAISVPAITTAEVDEVVAASPSASAAGGAGSGRTQASSRQAGIGSNGSTAQQARTLSRAGSAGVGFSGQGSRQRTSSKHNGR